MVSQKRRKRSTTSPNKGKGSKRTTAPVISLNHERTSPSDTSIHAMRPLSEKDREILVRSAMPWFTWVRTAATVCGWKQQNFVIAKGSRLVCSGLPLNRRAEERWKKGIRARHGKCTSMSDEILYSYSKLKANWQAIELAMNLQFGCVRHDPQAPQNRHILRLKLGFAIRLVYCGFRQTTKNFSQHCRRIAVGQLEGRAEECNFDAPRKMVNCKSVSAGSTDPAYTQGTNERAFLASTLARGLIVGKAPRHTVVEAVKDARDRLENRTPMPAQPLLDKLSVFTKKRVGQCKVSQKKETRMSLPLPNNKACYERSGAKGGATVVFQKHGKRTVAERIDLGKAAVVKEMMEYRAFMAWFRNRQKIFALLQKDEPTVDEVRQFEGDYDVLHTLRREFSFLQSQDPERNRPATCEQDRPVPAWGYDPEETQARRPRGEPGPEDLTPLEAYQVLRTRTLNLDGRDDWLGTKWDLLEGLDGPIEDDNVRSKFFHLQYKCLQPGYIQPWLDPALDIECLLSTPDWWGPEQYGEWFHIFEKFFSPVSEFDLLEEGYEPREEDLPGYAQAIPRERPMEDAFLAALEHQRDLSNQTAKLVPIVEPNGKIRVITIHPSESVWAARAMTQWIMVRTKKLTFSRQMMRDDVVNITNKSQSKEGLVLYSADLSKATDPISVPLARLVLQNIVEVTGKPAWWDEAVEACITEMQVEMPSGRTFTNKCGALMGLGPCWSVLTLLNAFAAHEAGAPDGSYQVCGDDLIGLWPQRVCDAYEDVISRLGLEANSSKSFRSRTGGVFCERLVRRVSDSAAFAKHCMRIGEAVGSKSEAGKKGRAVVDSLRLDTGRWPRHFDKVHPLVAHAARRTAYRNSISHTAKGRFDQGGGGVGNPDAVAVVAFINSGPTRLSQGDKILDTTAVKSELRKCTVPRIRGPLNRSTHMTMNDVIVQGKTAIETRLRREKGVGSSRPVPLPRGTVKKMIHAGRADAKRLIAKHKGPIAAVRYLCGRRIDGGKPYVRVTPKLVRDVTCALRRRAFTAAIKAAQKSWQIPIPVEEGEKILLEAGLEGVRVQLSTLSRRTGDVELRSPNSANETD